MFETVLRSTDRNDDAHAADTDRTRPLSRSELEEAVKEGVREGIEAHERSHHGVGGDGETSDDDDDGGTGTEPSSSRRLITARRVPVALLGIALLAFLRKKRAGNADGTGGTDGMDIEG